MNWKCVVGIGSRNMFDVWCCLVGVRLCLGPVF